MKKKVGVILTAGLMAGAVLMSAGLAGCNSAKITEFVMPEGGYDGKKVTITFANTTGSDLEGVISDALERFNELYPNITVNVDNNTKNWDDLSKKIGNKLSTGKQPNVAFCYSDHVATYNRANAVVALDQFFLPGSGYEEMTVTNTEGTESLGLTQEQVEDYIEAFYEDGGAKVYADGHTYTLPFAKSTEVLFYNKTKFKELGIVDENGEAKAPTTWTEFEEVSKKLAAVDNSSIALGYDSEANLFITMCEQLELEYTSLDRDNHYLFNTEDHKDFVKQLKSWYDNRYLITRETNSGTYTSNLFKIVEANKKRIFMCIGSTGGAQYQIPDSTDGQGLFDVGVAPIPQKYSTDPEHPEYKEGYVPKAILQGPNVCIFKKANPQEVLASWLLVKFLTTDAEFQGRYSMESGYSPVTYSAFNNPVYKEFRSKNSLMARVATVCYEYAQEDAFFTSPAFIGSSTARAQVGALVKNYLDGSQKNIDTAFNNAIQECSRYR